MSEIFSELRADPEKFKQLQEASLTPEEKLKREEAEFKKTKFEREF